MGPLLFNLSSKGRAQLACLVACAFLTACAGDSGSDPAERGASEEAVEVILHEVSFETEPNRVEAIGTARAKTFATLYPKTGGEVTSISFVAGDYVEAGQPLLRLEAREETLAVERAQIAVRDAEQLLDRYERIDVPEAISDSQIDEAQTALDAAKVELALARNALAERTVRAPFSGFIGFTDLDKGARITPQTPIARLDDRSQIFVDFEAPEQVFGDLEIGDIIEMEPFSLSGTMIEAEIQTIDSGIDPEQRNFRVRTVTDNQEDRLRPGMSFRIVFDLPGERYPAIPEAAIVWGGDGAFLWSVENGQASRLPVTIVARREGTVLVKAPLEPGSSIVSEGVQKVREGQAVTSARRAGRSQRSALSSEPSDDVSGQPR